ncbi:MAG TPA: guanine deaminase [Propionibacteriaceae bacterium]|jgi:guanine deaminase|nr:guanine deaminase [Propionibacteriaceae bacterium]
MTLYRAAVLDVPGDPFVAGAAALRAESDGAIVVRDGTIVARGAYTDLAVEHREEDTVDLRGGLLLPGLVDTHVHYPQVRAIAGLGLPLLDWLERRALPEEALLTDDAYAEVVAEEFLSGLAQAGTTTALVFGAHFASATDIFFTAAERSGLRITAGQVLSDRLLRPDLLISPDVALVEGRKLVERWHGEGRLRYAVTPRFSLSTTPAMLEIGAELLTLSDGIWFTSHLNENITEVTRVLELFDPAEHYLDSYARHGLVTRRSVFAHNLHARDEELELLASSGAWVAHCPTSNAALGSGLFPFRRHVEHGARVALGSDVGGGTGFSLFKEALQAYFGQRLLGPDGLPLTATHLLHLATRAGAQALGLDAQVGDLSAGKQFDALWLHPAEHSTLDVVLRHATDADDALAKVFALAGPADVARVWVGGDQVR